MNLKSLSKEIAKETGLTQQKSLDATKRMIEVMIEQILKGHVVKLHNFGTFKIDVVPESNYFNPITNTHCKKPRRFVLKHNFSKNLKQKINEKKTY